MTASSQLDLVDLLRDQLTRAQDALTSIDESLNPEIDANPEDKLLMEMLDVSSDARETLAELDDLLNTMQRRDEENS